MEWFSVVKRRKKSMQGNIPHLYQWLTRLVRPASEHTKEYLDKYCAWEDLPDDLKEYFKDFVFRDIKSNISPGTRWGRDPIPGIILYWTGNNFTVDEDAYNDWRTAQGGSHSEPLNNWSLEHKVNSLYHSVQRELKYCWLYKHNRQNEIDYHYNSRFYDGSWARLKHPSRTKYGALNK